MKKTLVQNLFFKELVYILSTIAIVHILDYGNIITPIFLSFGEKEYIYGFEIIFFTLLYMFSFYAYKLLQTKLVNMSLFSRWMIGILIFVLVGYLSTVISYLVVGIFYTVSFKGWAVVYNSPEFFLIALIAPFFPIYIWIAGVINGFFLISYHETQIRNKS